jgi:hypothetical protein
MEIAHLGDLPQGRLKPPIGESKRCRPKPKEAALDTFSSY